MVDSILDDIWVQILKRLSIKFLLRCRCVKKSWYNLIQTPHFISSHSKYHKQSSNNKHLLLLHSPYNSFFSLCFDDEQCNEYYNPVPKFLENKPGDWRSYGASNGIICLSTLKLSYHSNIYLWNPAIGKLKNLPNSRQHFIYPPFGMNLGFGYFSKIDDYKVVKVLFYPDDTKTRKIDVYSLKTNSWKTISEKFMNNFSCNKLSSNSVVVKSEVFWLGQRKRRRKRREKVIVSFDINKEIVREISIPKYVKNCFQSIFISVVDKKLGVLLYNTCSDVVDIWVREKDGVEGMWMKKCTLSLEHRCIPVGFRNNGEMIFRVLKWPVGFVYYYINAEQDFVDDYDVDSFDLWSYAKQVFVDDSYDVWPSSYDRAYRYNEFDNQTMFLTVFMENLVLLNT